MNGFSLVLELAWGGLSTNGAYRSMFLSLKELLNSKAKNPVISQLSIAVPSNSHIEQRTLYSAEKIAIFTARGSFIHNCNDTCIQLPHQLQMSSHTSLHKMATSYSSCLLQGSELAMCNTRLLHTLHIAQLHV